MKNLFKILLKGYYYHFCSFFHLVPVNLSLVRKTILEKMLSSPWNNSLVKRRFWTTFPQTHDDVVCSTCCLSTSWADPRASRCQLDAAMTNTSQYSLPSCCNPLGQDKSVLFAQFHKQTCLAKHRAWRNSKYVAELHNTYINRGGLKTGLRKAELCCSYNQSCWVTLTVTSVPCTSVS